MHKSEIIRYQVYHIFFIKHKIYPLKQFPSPKNCFYTKALNNSIINVKTLFLSFFYWICSLINKI